MFSKKTLALALAALLPCAAGAVSLGDLTVESRPGEPLDAVLEIRDVDLDVSPLRVRIAPEATYSREGLERPEEASRIRIERDSKGQTLRVRVLSEGNITENFPLLIELNAGDVISMRRYEVVVEDGRYSVRVPEEGTSAAAKKSEPVSAAETSAPLASSASIEKAEAVEEPRKAERTEKIEKAGDAAPIAETAAEPRRAERRGRYGPSVVKEYVEREGFDPEEAFEVRQDMTFWSILSLYWPSYEGTTIEQLGEAFLLRNPNAFLESDMSRLVVGAHLTPPTADEAFAVSPEGAFRRMRGGDEVVPMSTRNLIDAQHVSRECAVEVARAQNAKRRSGGTALEIAEAGRKALEEYKGRVVLERELTGDAHAGEPAEAYAGEGARMLGSGPEADRARESAQMKSESDVAGAADSALSNTAVAPAINEKKTESEKAGVDAPVQDTVRPAVSAEPKSDVQTEAMSEAPAASDAAPAASDEKPGFLEKLKEVNVGWWALLALLIAIFVMMRRTGGKVPESDAKDDGAKKPQAVALRRDVKPASEAQLKAVSATIDECVKNGTTAGAMGVGAMAYTEARMAEERKAKAESDENAALAAANAPEAQPEKKLDQPWLDPEDDELPPMDDEERRGLDAEAQKRLEEKLSAIDLSVEGAAVSARTRTIVTEEESAIDGYVPPLMPEPVQSGGAVESVGASEPVVETPAPAPSSLEAPSEKERALWKALDAKLNLAGSFIGLGALDEARELLEEVKRGGSPEQRERAAFLEARIDGRS